MGQGLPPILFRDYPLNGGQQERRNYQMMNKARIVAVKQASHRRVIEVDFGVPKTMHIKSIFKTATAVVAVLSLAGCLGSNSSSTPTSAPSGSTGGSTAGGTTGGGTTGGTTGGGTTGGTTGGGTTGGSTTGGGTTGGTTGGSTSTQAAFDTKSQSYIFLVPTSRPITGTANYTGEISMLTQANAADAAEAVVGNLNMGVNFGSGVTNPVTATAGNFSGNVNGQATTLTGTLSTANAIAGDVNSVTATTNQVGTITGVTATLRGAVSGPGGGLSGDARMILNGNLKEAGGAKISGGHQTTIFPTGGGTSIATGGSLYADKN